MVNRPVFIIGDANVDSPLNAQAAKLWSVPQKSEYKELVLKMHSSGEQ